MFLSGVEPADDDSRILPLASLLNYKPPPSIVVAAAYDPLFDDATELANALTAGGAQTDLIRASDMTHGFARVQGHSKSATAWMTRVAQRFAEHLHGR